MRSLIFCLATLNLAVSSAATAHNEHCSTDSGRYAIYANGDRLRIHGSRHILSVVIDPLDERLEKVGWEKAAAEGTFTICYDKAVSPLSLTIRDAVEVKSYSKVRIVRR